MSSKKENQSRKTSSVECSTRDLKSIQSFVISSIKRPLSDDFKLKEENFDKSEVDSFVKPSSRQDAISRLEIYAQQYWYRLMDSLEEDFPAILAVLGRKRFNSLLRSYLAEYPSDSHLLRDLGRYMDEFVQDNPKLVEPHFDLVFDLAKFEWAQVYAFDREQLAPVTLEEIENLDLENHGFHLQPYLTLLELNFLLDDYSIALKKSQRQISTSEASSLKKEESSKPEEEIPLPKRKKNYLVVHRYNGRVYFKSLDKHAYKLLELIAAGNSIGVACGELIQSYPELESDIASLSANVQDWFRAWVKLGWLVIID